MTHVKPHLSKDAQPLDLESRAGRSRLTLFILPEQILADSLLSLMYPDTGMSRDVRVLAETAQFARPPDFSVQTEDHLIDVVSPSGSIDLVCRLLKCQTPLAAFSTRANIVLDAFLVKRILRVSDSMSRISNAWMTASADGVDIDNRFFFSAFFERQPTLLPTRGTHPVVQTYGTLCVLNMSSFSSIREQPSSADLPVFLNRLILAGYKAGIPSFFADRLFPAILDEAKYPPADVIAHLSSPSMASVINNDPMHTGNGVCVNHEDVASWVMSSTVAAFVQQRVSFVVRTIFRRPHLLHRCLISIDYIGRSLDFKPEILLSTDVDGKAVSSSVSKLKRSFPNLKFIVADGQTESGHSRVRNLKAGIMAATQDYVAIIDDDDFYTPAAVEVFGRLRSGTEERLFVMDTQIVQEKWTERTTKHQREVTGYGQRYKAVEWPVLFSGTNSIPLCGAIHPREFLQEVVKSYHFQHDLSEDFLLHLIAFSHRTRPRIEIFNKAVYAYQSQRAGEDNVSTAQDRKDWCADTGNGLYYLLFEQKFTFDIISGLEADLSKLGGKTHADPAALAKENRDLRAALSEALARLAMSI